MYTDRAVYDTYRALMRSYNQSYVKYLMNACFGQGWKSRVSNGKKLSAPKDVPCSSKLTDIHNIDTESFHCACGGLMGVSQYGKICDDCGTKVTLKVY